MALDILGQESKAGCGDRSFYTGPPTTDTRPESDVRGARPSAVPPEFLLLSCGGPSLPVVMLGFVLRKSRPLSLTLCVVKGELVIALFLTIHQYYLRLVGVNPTTLHHPLRSYRPPGAWVSVVILFMMILLRGSPRSCFDKLLMPFPLIVKMQLSYPVR